MTIDSPQGAIRQDTVLVVDDEEDIRTSVAHILEQSLQDVEVVTAVDGKEALRCLDAGGIDLIIADFRMPGMNGIELLQESRRKAPDVPRILMTAFGDMDIALQAINEAHVHSFFPKPFEPEQVVDTVWKALDQHWEHVQKEENQSKSLRSLGATGDQEEDHHEKENDHSKR